MDGFYIAAAGAGYESADVIIQNPITNKVFSGFTILGNKTFSNLTLQQLAAAGVTVLQPVAGGGTVIWGITTSQSGFPEEQEISIVFIRDRVAKVLRICLQGLHRNSARRQYGCRPQYRSSGNPQLFGQPRPAHRLHQLERHPGYCGPKTMEYLGFGQPSLPNRLDLYHG